MSVIDSASFYSRAPDGLRTVLSRYLIICVARLPLALYRKSKFLACGLLVRGDVVVSDVNANIERLAAELDMVHWNPEGYKIGLCSVPPIGSTHSLLSLSNNCCIK